MKNKRSLLIGILITLTYFLIHFAIINDYGVSWDYHYHLYAGLYHLGLSVPSIDSPPPVPFASPDPRLSVTDPFGPFTQIIPALSYHLFFEKWHLFPFDSAYNFPMVIFGALGVGLLFMFVYETIGFIPAVISSVFLALLPSYFGYLHNNMKDIPNAFAFTLAIYLFWKLVQKRRLIDLVLAVASFAFAFNVKINSVFIPVVCFVWFVLCHGRDLFDIVRKGKFQLFIVKRLHLIILYFVFAPLFAILLWWPFWQDPIGKLLELPYFYSHNTLNMPVLLMGTIYRSGVNIPWYYPFFYIAITVPIPILVSFIVGLILSLVNFRKKNYLYLLLVIWFFLPLLRYFNPKTGAIDGIRHFMEIVYPLCFISGIGAMWLYERIIIFTKSKSVGIIIGIIVFLSLIRNIILFHPYQTSFFNLVIGGIKGADGKVDIDFWGTPQRETVVWLNKNAPLNSTVYVLMAKSSAGMYLRTDLLKNLNSKSIEDSDYVVLLNRESFYSMYNYDLESYLIQKTEENKIVFTKLIEGVPLVWVFGK
jgi:hypothetical protein